MELHTVKLTRTWDPATAYDRIRQGPEEKLPPSEAEEQRSDDPLAFVVVSYPEVTPHFAQGGQHDVDG